LIWDFLNVTNGGGMAAAVAGAVGAIQNQKQLQHAQILGL
jgi:hypothetical protein